MPHDIIDNRDTCLANSPLHLTTNRAAPAANTTFVEREIDDRVCRLYGLTADETKITGAAAE